MKITSTYSVRLRNFNRVFDDTVEVYRHAVDYFIELVIANWNTHFANLSRANDCIRVAEGLSVRTKKRLMTPYNFCHDFVKFPSYLRRAAIMAAYGQVSSYQTRLAQWKAKPGQKGRQPGLPKAGRSFPVMYRDNTFIRAGRNSVKLKVRIRNTWDWVDVELDKHDVDYIALHCAARNELSPALRKRGKKWYLDFSFEEKVILDKVSLDTQRVLGVDLGINNACVCSVMDSKGTIIGRRFKKLPVEQDSLERALRRIRKAQSNGAKRMPRLWARAKGVNKDIAVKTAGFIMTVANEFKVDVIVMEHLDLAGRKRGSKRQRLHHWRAKYVQQIVEHQAHRCGTALRRIRKAQSNGAKRMPRLWARAKGVNKDIAVKTAGFIMTVANEFKVDVIVMEHLDLAGRKRGSKRQRLHHWRAKYVQQIVEHQAHRCGTRIRRVCSWNTSKLAFDGTGDVTRDTDNYSMCTFQTGKRYSCDLSASYNIGARYFLREYEKSISATRWRCIAAKVPSCAKRITRTLDTLIRVNAELRSM